MPENGSRNGVRPRLGFLGTGWIGLHRMQRIADSGAADITVICDSSAEILAQAAKAAPSAITTNCFEELLEADIDGVVIATPSALHAEQAIRALERGLAVFCQKPLGRNADEVASVVRAAQSADRLLGIDLSYRFTKGMRKVREKITAGEIGNIYACDLVFHNAYGPDKPWFYDRNSSGGGCLIDLGIHLVDLALWTLDFPRVTEISSHLFAKGKPLTDADVEDYAIATLRIENDMVVRIACSWRLPAGCDAIISAAFYGTEGGLSFYNLNGSFYNFVAEQFRGTARTMLANLPDDWGGRAAVSWATQLADNRKFNPEVLNIIDVAATLDRIYETGRKSPPGSAASQRSKIQFTSCSDAD
jgi:predicted dehydrogenase